MLKSDVTFILQSLHIKSINYEKTFFNYLSTIIKKTFMPYFDVVKYEYQLALLQ